MLSATEQLTWTARLDRFKRGCDDSRASVGQPESGRRQTEQPTWQNFSGSHLTCKVIFTEPIEKPWPSHNSQSPTNCFALASELDTDRQLRIIVVCQEEQSFSSGAMPVKSQEGAKIASQPTASLVLVCRDEVMEGKIVQMLTLILFQWLFCRGSWTSTSSASTRHISTPNTDSRLSSFVVRIRAS